MEGRRHYGQLIARRRLRPLVAALIATIALAFFTAFAGVLVGVLATSIGVLGWAFARWRWPRLGKGYRVDALVTPSALYLARVGSSFDHTRTIARRSLRAGYVLPAANGAFVVLRGRFGVVARMRFDDVDAARAFLDDLGLSPVGRPMTFAFFFNLRIGRR